MSRAAKLSFSVNNARNFRDISTILFLLIFCYAVLVGGRRVTDARAWCGRGFANSDLEKGMKFDGELHEKSDPKQADGEAQDDAG